MEQTPIHVIGLGSIGVFVAHSLQTAPHKPTVTLLIHKQTLYEDFISKSATLSVKDGGSSSVETSSGYVVEILKETHPTESSNEFIYVPAQKTVSAGQNPSEPGHITCLIVTVKATATVSALRPLRHRLGPNSTIVLLQNGLGQIDELNKNLFTEIEQRPTYIQGVLVLGSRLESPFTAICAYKGHCKLGAVYPTQDLTNEALRSYSIEMALHPLLSLTSISCQFVESKELLEIQLNKLAANCVLNPLTALLDVQNGGILHTPGTQHLMNSIIKEISRVLELLPEVRNLGLTHQFTVERLRAAVTEVVTKTAQNSNSMREDVRKRRPTEIDYLNGYIVRRGQEVGVSCEVNQILMQLVHARSALGCVEGREHHGTSLSS